MVQVLVQKEYIAQEGKASDADGGWRKNVCLLRDKVLRPVVFSHGEPWDIGAHRRERICRRAAAVHVPEIQVVCCGQIMIQSDSELVVILDEGLSGDESIRPRLWQGKERQHIRRNRIDGREESHLVERHRCSKISEL